MFEKLQTENNNNNNGTLSGPGNNLQNSNSRSRESFLDEEAENLLFPITNNDKNGGKNHNKRLSVPKTNHNQQNHNNLSHNHNHRHSPATHMSSNNSKDDNHSQPSQPSQATHSTFSHNDNSSNKKHVRSYDHISNNLSLEQMGVDTNMNNMNNMNNNMTMNNMCYNQSFMPPSNGNIQILTSNNSEYGWGGIPKVTNNVNQFSPRDRDRNMSLSSQGMLNIISPSPAQLQFQNNQFPNGSTPFVYGNN